MSIIDDINTVKTSEDFDIVLYLSEKLTELNKNDITDLLKNIIEPLFNELNVLNSNTDKKDSKEINKTRDCKSNRVRIIYGDKYDKEFINIMEPDTNNINDDFKYFKKLIPKRKRKYLNTINDLKESHINKKPKLFDILDTNMSDSNKLIIFNKLKVLIPDYLWEVDILKKNNG